MLKSNLDKIFALINDGNNLGEPITLVGATKMVAADTINKAIDLGLKVVAENKVQEFREKTCFINNADQHFIGHLQTNKAKYLVGKVSLIQSVDSIKLATEINRLAINKGITQNVLVEINVGGELSKSGFDLDNAFDNILQIKNEFKNIKIVGLMAMLPKSDDEDYLACLCDKARNLYDNLKNKINKIPSKALKVFLKVLLILIPLALIFGLCCLCSYIFRGYWI